MIRILSARTTLGTEYRIRCRPVAPGVVEVLEAHRRPPGAARFTRAALRGRVPFADLGVDGTMAEVFGRAAMRRIGD